MRALLYSAISLLIVIAIITFLFISSRSANKNAFFVRNLNDATYDCEEKINNQFGPNLLYKSYDNFSSRYQAKDKQYLIYYRISVKDEQDFSIINDYIVKCIVWEKLGYVSSFEILEP